MKVILQEKVTNLGKVGDQVNVRPGFARNFLLPRGKALKATEANIVAFENRRVELEKKAAETQSAAESRAKALAGHVITMAAQASEEGKLFGSIGPRDIAKAMSDAGKAVESVRTLQTNPNPDVGAGFE